MSVPVQAAEKKQEEVTHIKTDEVVVTASRTKQEVKESPSSVEVITREDIDKMGAESVRQALQLALGLDTMENGMVGNQVSIRGMYTNQTLILIDGRRVRTENTNQTTNYYELERINMDDVERIEIVRGAASSLYGSEALGGVVNIIKKRPGKQQTAVTLDWTSRQSDEGIRFDSGKLGKWGLSASFKHMDIRERGTDVTSNMYGKKYFFNLDGRMDMTKDKWLDVFFDYMTEDLYMKTADSITHSKQGESYDHKRFSTGVKYSGRDKRGDYEMQVYYTYFDKHQRTRQRANNVLNSFDDMKYNSLIFDGRRSIQVAKDHLLTFGGEYRKEDYESTRIKGSNRTTLEGVTTQLGDSSMDFAALYLQDEWVVNPRWLIIPSLRWDYNSEFGNELTGKLGTTYKITKDLRFKANVGTAYRAPTASELYFSWQHLPTPRMEVHINGNPDLKPEKALNFDLGFEFEQDKTFGKITYFHNKVDDLIRPNTIVTPRFIPGFGRRMIANSTYGNIDSVTMQGVELEARQALGSGFTLRGLYTYLDARNNNTNVRLQGHPYHKASLQLSYDDAKNGWNATLWNDWTAGYRYEETVGSGRNARTVAKDASLSIMNFVVSKKINDHFSAYVGIDNIFNKDSDVLAYDGRIWRGGVNMTF